MARTKPQSSSRGQPSRPSAPATGEAETWEGAFGEMPEAIVITDERHGIVWANEEFTRLCGYSTGELCGKTTRLLHGPKTRLPASEDTPAGENWLHHKDGTPFFAAWKSCPAGRDMQPGALLVVYHDRTEIRRLQDALLHSQKLDTVGQLASGVAHDFNNLLSIINGYCEIMQGKIAAVPEAQKDLQEIHRAGLKAAGIARQILEFSRRTETQARVVNANTLIREIADILRRVVGESVQFELRLASDIGNTRIDPTQFQQVLLNLCFNARDAMPQGGRLTIRTARRQDGAQPPGSSVVVQVVDTGTGMDEASRARIFEPFYTTKLHGTGLGLSTVINIVKQAGGSLSVDSEPGKGARFEILLPETPEPEQLHGTALAALPSTRGTESVWLVEADEVLRKMVAGILNVDGYRVREIATPVEILRAGRAVQETPQILIVDCGVDGTVELARLLKENNRLLKVLSLSVEPPIAVLPEFSIHALAHLPKPFALSTLLRLTRGLLDRH